MCLSHHWIVTILIYDWPFLNENKRTFVSLLLGVSWAGFNEDNHYGLLCMMALQFGTVLSKSEAADVAHIH